MPTYMSIKLDVDGAKYNSASSYNSGESYNANDNSPLRQLLSALKMSNAVIPFVLPPAPPVYNFIVMGNTIKLITSDFLDISGLKMGFIVPLTGYNFLAMSLKLEMSDLPNMSNLKCGFLMSLTGYNFQNMGVRIYFKNFSLGYGGVDLF